MVIRVQIRESDPLWAAMVERVVAVDPQLSLCPEGSAEVPDVVVLGEGRLSEKPPPSAVIVALVEVHAGETAGQLRELVVNAVKHAQPARVDVSVKAAQGAVVLEVVDDGVGIDSVASGRAARAGHLGLAAVRRRVEDSGGRFEISCASEGGTRARVSVGPLSG